MGHHLDVLEARPGTRAATPTGRVLVVEDDRSLRRVLTELLGRDGHEVVTCGRGSEVAAAVADHDPDLVLLDLGLPDVSGLDLLRDLAAARPVLVLSGRDGEADRVLALDLGAQDYVVKPFGNLELLARVRARLRASAPAGAATGPARVGDGDLAVDAGSREVRLQGVPVPLTAKEFDLLHALASAPRRVRTRHELLVAAWGPDADAHDEGAVTEHVHRLRQKVGAERIATVRGVGYRFDPVPQRTS